MTICIIFAITAMWLTANNTIPQQEILVEIFVKLLTTIFFLQTYA